MRALSKLSRAAILLAAALCLAAPAGAEVYGWTDAHDTVHFTDELHRVPPEQRERAVRDASRRSHGRTASSGEVRIPFERDGNLLKLVVRLDDRIEAAFYMDTGASGVVIPQKVADQLGFDSTAAAEMVAAATAGGSVLLPVMTLRSLSLGGARIRSLRAVVNPNLQVGLLGGAFFNRFAYSVDTSAGVITLRPNNPLPSNRNISLSGQLSH